VTRRHGNLSDAVRPWKEPRPVNIQLPASAPRGVTELLSGRVLLAEGLVDSAFWHRFVLTRHSAMYAAWEKGKHPGLEPILPRTSFALNDLEFRGEERSERWTAPLDAALAAWADAGEVEKPLSSFLPKGLPRPKLDALAVLREAGLL